MTALNYAHVEGTPENPETILTTGSWSEFGPAPTSEAEWLVLGDRALRELADCRAEQSANTAACKVEVARLQAAFDDLNRPLVAREERLVALLEQVARALPLRGKRSRNLAFGSIGWTAAKARLEVQDPAAALTWALKQPDEIATRITKRVEERKIVKKELDLLWESTGEVPEGCAVLPAEDRFYARPSTSAPDIAA